MNTTAQVEGPPAATDRGRRGSVLAKPRVGIDTVRVRGPVARGALGALPTQRQRGELDVLTGELVVTPTSSEALTRNGLPWRVDVWRGPAEVVFEASVPRLLRGDNSRGATVGELWGVMRDFYDEVGQQVTWLCDLSELSLVRLDVLRTFTADPASARAGACLAALSKWPAERARTRIHPDAAYNGVQNLERYTERWQTRLYRRDQHYVDRARHRTGADAAHLQALAEQERGRIRFELELRSRGLATHGLRTLADLDEQRLEEHATRYFTRSRFDRRVGRDNTALAAAERQLRAQGKYNQLGPMLGVLTLDAAGLPPSCGKATAKKYHGLAAELGVTTDDLLADALEPMRLDWGSGRLLTGLAAIAGPDLQGPVPRVVRALHARTGASDNSGCRPREPSAAGMPGGARPTTRPPDRRPLSAPAR